MSLCWVSLCWASQRLRWQTDLFCIERVELIERDGDRLLGSLLLQQLLFLLLDAVVQVLLRFVVDLRLPDGLLQLQSKLAWMLKKPFFLCNIYPWANGCTWAGLICFQHASLFWILVSDEEKKFYIIDYYWQCYKTFFPLSPMFQTNKLEWLSLR